MTTCTVHKTTLAHQNLKLEILLKTEVECERGYDHIIYETFENVKKVRCCVITQISWRKKGIYTSYVVICRSIGKKVPGYSQYVI